LARVDEKSGGGESVGLEVGDKEKTRQQLGGKSRLNNQCLEAEALTLDQPIAELQ
jgi:hypothetical protein